MPARRSAANSDESVPVLLFTGATASGKSTIAGEASRLLREARVPHALVDLALIGSSWPVPEDDPWNERVTHRNLACMWKNFQAAGAGRLVLCRVLEARSLLRHVVQAVPGADVTVIRLRAPLPVLEERIRAREAAADPAWYLAAAAYLVEALERSPVEDFCIDNVDCPAQEVATEALRLAGWLGELAERPSQPP